VPQKYPQGLSLFQVAISTPSLPGPALAPRGTTPAPLGAHNLLVRAESEHGAAPESTQLDDAAAIGGRLLANIERVLRGKQDEIRLVLAALTCHGHVLFEDVPGTGKTVLARAIAASIEDALFARVQCTPDLQPSDVTGLNIYNQRSQDFEFRRGPLFANVVLVDEINRAMPKTQSALLEAMAERQVTIDGQTHVLPQPFLVLATENPIEFEGVFPLPEAQLDRFFLKARLGYPGEEDELAVVLDQQEGHPLEQLRPVVGVQDLARMEAALPAVYVDDLVRRWMIRLVRTTRQLEEVSIGASVRGSLALERAARAWALLNGRAFTTPEDVERMFSPVLGHRLVFSPSFIAEARGRSRAEILHELYRRCARLAPPPELSDLPAAPTVRWTPAS
jgi:MoxR-like ATPase